MATLIRIGVLGVVLATLWIGGTWLPLFQRAAWTFSDVDDPEVQISELGEYVRQIQRPVRLVAENLAEHRKVSQYTDIDSSASGFGQNACGLVAAAAALGGEDWTPLVSQIAEAAGDDYHPNVGIQPSDYADALAEVFGADRVVAIDRGTLGQLYRILETGQVVIVDLKVSATSRSPSAEPPNYAHFARVLGMDTGAGEIYLENTLAGKATWTLPFADFLAAWQLPETTASILLATHQPEAVSRWAVVIDPRESFFQGLQAYP